VWSQQAKLVASDAAGSDQFGYSVALSGNTAIAGASKDDHAGGVDAGSAYTFDVACTGCVGDIIGNGGVNVDDLLALINAWGPCAPIPAPCPADITGDDAVNIDDLLILIGAKARCSTTRTR
jgi:hypothetical protein